MRIYRKTNVSASNNMYAEGLDGRFAFDMPEDFEIYVGNDRITCYTIDASVIGDGAGVSYTVAIPLNDVHWQSDEWINRGLNEYFSEATDGSDYTYGINTVEQSIGIMSDLPNIDADYWYTAEVEIIPYQNISPWGDLGIDYGTEEYFDHVVNDAPWPPVYED